MGSTYLCLLSFQAGVNQKTSQIEKLFESAVPHTQIHLNLRLSGVKQPHLVSDGLVSRCGHQMSPCVSRQSVLSQDMTGCLWCLLTRVLVTAKYTQTAQHAQREQCKWYQKMSFCMTWYESIMNEFLRYICYMLSDHPLPHFDLINIYIINT